MKHLLLDDILENNGLKKGVTDSMKSGAIFIYPTDTVYGIGCDAGNSKSVAKVREIKQTKQPFSVIAPSKKWIKHKLKIMHTEYLKRLPGQYTLIFTKKRKGFLQAASTS